MKENEDFPCSLCGGQMTVIPDRTGVMVKCYNPCDPGCHENVFGHGRNAREAWEVSTEKYRKTAVTVAAVKPLRQNKL